MSPHVVTMFLVFVMMTAHVHSGIVHQVLKRGSHDSELVNFQHVDNDKYPTPLEFDCNYICEDDKGCYDYCLKTHADYQRMPEYVVPEYVMPEYVAPARAIPAQPYRVSAPTSVRAAPTSVRAAPTARVATTAPAAAPAAASASTKATVAPKKAQ